MHTIRDKAKLLGRVRRIKGQADALERQFASAENEDCSAVLQQIAAIRGAVNGLMLAVIEGHLTEHVVNEPDQDKRADDLDAVFSVIQSYLK